MKIKTNILVKMIIVSVSMLCFTGCESDINTKKQSDDIFNIETEDTSNIETSINNNIYYIEVGNNKKIPFLQKENIEILDVKVEDSIYVSSLKDIKTQFINNSNVELKNVDFIYEFEDKKFSSTTLYNPTPSKEIATTNLINLDLFF